MIERLLRVVIVMAALGATLPGLLTASAHGDVANGNFDGVWERTDLPVAEGQANRTWMWGPEPFTGALSEPYWESPGGWRQVQYFDKSRMEISNPNGDESSVWYVTNGLLAKELMTGEISMSDGMIVLFTGPAAINVAGDGDDPDGPTYATFETLRSMGPYPDGHTITATVDREGNVGEDGSLASQGVTAEHFVSATNHSVASVFWDFMNSSGTIWDGSNYGELQGLTMDYSAALTGGDLPLKGCFDYTDVQTTAIPSQLPGLEAYYGFDVAADIVGRLCGVQQRSSNTYWYQLIGSADIYQGTTPSGEKIDTRAYQIFGYFTEPNNTIGDLPRPEECTVERYYAIAGFEDIWAGIARSSDPNHWEFWAISAIDGTPNVAHWETYPCG